jgi:hypothetical protein
MSASSTQATSCTRANVAGSVVHYVVVAQSAQEQAAVSPCTVLATAAWRPASAHVPRHSTRLAPALELPSQVELDLLPLTAHYAHSAGTYGGLFQMVWRRKKRCSPRARLERREEPALLPRRLALSARPCTARLPVDWLRRGGGGVHVSMPLASSVRLQHLLV